MSSEERKLQYFIAGLIISLVELSLGGMSNLFLSPPTEVSSWRIDSSDREASHVYDLHDLNDCEFNRQ